jgi:hypothetical protein
MGVYDFNISSFNIDSIIATLRKDLQDIVVNSQTSIAEIKAKIAEDEVLLKRLKNAVDNLPDYTAQYNELKDEITKLNLALDELIKHPIVLDNIDVRGASGLISEVQKINGQFIYANHAVNDAQGNNIVDTYATKDELVQAEQRASDIEQSIIDNLTGEISRATEAESNLNTNIVSETTRAMSVETSISTDLNAEVTRSTNKDTELQQNINTLSNTVNDKESALNTKIVDETTRATAKETELETAISTETTAREAAVSNLETAIEFETESRRNEIDVVTNNLTEEVNRATDAEEALDSKIDSSVEALNGTISELNTTFSQALTQEQNTRSTADTTLQTNIDNEASARSEADTTLQTNIDNEATARENEDAALSSAITAEETARIEADSTLQLNIDAEANARSAKDTELQTQIDTIEATQNIVDIVGTKTELDNYDTTHLKDGAKIQVLDDETQNHASTIYKFNKSESSFSLVGTFGSYYTKAETENLISEASNDLEDTIESEASDRADADSALSDRINALDLAKQNNLTAGDGINITNDVVSHSIKVIENNNEEDTVEGTVFTVYLKNNHYKVITISKTITEIIFMIEKTAAGVLQETGFEFTVPEDSDLETLTFKVIDDNNKKIYTIIPDSYTSPNIYQGTIVNYRCTIGEYEVED